MRHGLIVDERVHESPESTLVVQDPIGEPGESTIQLGDRLSQIGCVELDGPDSVRESPERIRHIHLDRTTGCVAHSTGLLHVSTSVFSEHEEAI